MVGEGLAPPENEGEEFCFDRNKILDLQGFPLAISNRSLREDQGPPLPICASPFRSAVSPINQNLKDQRGFSSLFAVALQGLSKNGRGSRGAGGEAAPFRVAIWRDSL